MDSTYYYLISNIIGYTIITHALTQALKQKIQKFFITLSSHQILQHLYIDVCAQEEYYTAFSRFNGNYVTVR